MLAGSGPCLWAGVFLYGMAWDSKFMSHALLSLTFILQWLVVCVDFWLQLQPGPAAACSLLPDVT